MRWQNLAVFGIGILFIIGVIMIPNRVNNNVLNLMNVDDNFVSALGNSNLSDDKIIVHADTETFASNQIEQSGLSLLASKTLDGYDIMYAEDSETVCRNNSCVRKQYLGTRYIYEDNQWKGIENAKSLKRAKGIVIEMKNDSKYPIEIIDYNLTSAIVCFKPSASTVNTNVPLTIYRKDNSSSVALNIIVRIPKITDTICRSVPLGFNYELKYGSSSTYMSNRLLAGDGYVQATNATWATVHNGANGNSAPTLAYTIVQSSESIVYTISRGFVPARINFTGISTISKMNLTVYVQFSGYMDDDAQAYIAVVGNTTQASTTVLSTTDYDNCANTHSPNMFSKKYYLNTLTANTWLSINLTQQAIKSISRVTNLTYFGVREGHDIEDSAIGNTKQDRIKYASSENVTKYPYYSILYEIINDAPVLSNVKPTNNTANIQYYGGLTINGTVTDADGNTMTVKFINATNNAVWCTNSSIATGSTVRCRKTFSGGAKVKYYINVSDGIVNVKSGTYNFSFDTPRLVINLMTPTGNDDHNQYAFKVYKANVTCLGGYCGNVSVTLDPEMLK